MSEMSIITGMLAIILMGLGACYFIFWGAIKRLASFLINNKIIYWMIMIGIFLEAMILTLLGAFLMSMVASGGGM
ncbi:MAG: hypothetical protein QXT45_05420 [Candidatus Bilamarchaeaceae archaeon]